MFIGMNVILNDSAGMFDWNLTRHHIDTGLDMSTVSEPEEEVQQDRPMSVINELEQMGLPCVFWSIGSSDSGCGCGCRCIHSQDNDSLG